MRKGNSHMLLSGRADSRGPREKRGPIAEQSCNRVEAASKHGGQLLNLSQRA